MNSTARFTVGQLVRWRDGRCILRVEGFSTPSERYQTRFYNGPIVSGEHAGCYAMSVPEEQLEHLEQMTPLTTETPTNGGDAA